MNVLSLFDGMSCGQIALNKAAIKYDKYFSSEIKKHAIETTLINYPNTIQIGDVTKVLGKDLPKIDLLIGGSPCQDFSKANKVRNGLEGEKSKLFFEYIRILKETKPKYFLLENVIMNKYSYNFISNELGIYPININSSLVSACYRNRLYWTNIGPQTSDMFGNKYSLIPNPSDKKIILQDILESGYADVCKGNSLNTHAGVSEKSQDKFYHRYKTTGMDTAIFISPDLDWKKGLRLFTQLELERIQGIPEGYTKNLNLKKAWDVIGDGWTIPVIKHIFSYIV